MVRGHNARRLERATVSPPRNTRKPTHTSHMCCTCAHAHAHAHAHMHMHMDMHKHHGHGHGHGHGNARARVHAHAHLHERASASRPTWVPPLTCASMASRRAVGCGGRQAPCFYQRTSSLRRCPYTRARHLTPRSYEGQSSLWTSAARRPRPGASVSRSRARAGAFRATTRGSRGTHRSRRPWPSP